jgi:hypothetical protein
VQTLLITCTDRHRGMLFKITFAAGIMGFRVLVIGVLLLLCGSVQAQKAFPKYDVVIAASNAELERGTSEMAAKLLADHPMMATKFITSDIELPHYMKTQTADFYLLLFLCLILGMIRFMDTRYFLNLWRAFWNPTLSNRQLKEQLQGSGMPNLLMNIFFVFAGGAYIYYVVRFFTPYNYGVIPPSLLIIMLILGTAVIYFAKYLAVRFSGWAFRVEGITEHYLFNVFLINKVLGVTLIPFIIILAFAEGEWARQVVIISFVVAGILLLNRYIRSWQVFGSFFQYSKFHFFMYLCASELLPLAVLMKLLVKGLLFY